MTLNRRQLLQGSSLLLLLGRTHLSRGASIVAVRMWPAADYTRVTIESDTLLRATHRLVGQPHRLAVDIEGLELDAQLKEIVAKVQPNDPFISGVRVGQFTSSVVRLVFDLKQAIAPQVFTLQPVAPYQHRLVFDLYPIQPRDPLELLIAESLATSPSSSTQAGHHLSPGANPSEMDPIAQLMAKQLEKTSPPTAATPPSSASKEAKNTFERLAVVALDPGHGGEDPGAIGPGGTQEKNVVLQVALKLRDRINSTVIPGPQGPIRLRAFMTRDADFFVPLHIRVQKARRVQADLFISIHADAFFTPSARGASVYALSDGAASSTAANWIANKENKADLIGGVNLNVKDTTVQRALFDMSTTAQIKDSLNIGHTLLAEIQQVGKLHKPKVEQAGFAVLKAPDIPSVLVETAFISNPDEEIKLKSDAYQSQLADALMRGIQMHFERHPPKGKNPTA